MSTTVGEAPDRPIVNELYHKETYHSRSGSLSSRSIGRVAGSAVAALKAPTMTMNSQNQDKRRSTDASASKPSRTGTKDSVDSRTDKNSKPSNSVVPSALKNVGRKLKSGNNYSVLEFNPGLVNLGNSCYLNSTLQGLMSTRLLENMFEFTIPSDFAGRLFPERSPALRNGRGGQFELEYVRGMELCMTFIRTLESGWRLRNAKQRVSMNARELRNRLGHKYDQYLDFQQQDAHEFLRHLLDCMYMEEFDIIKKRQPPIPKRRRGEPPVDPPPVPVPENERLIPFVDQVFGGQLASMLICSNCKKVSHTYEPFMDLSISIRSEEDKESKRNRLKAFAQRFTRQAGRPVLRPLSNPPSPRKAATELLDPPVNVDRRRSAEILGNRSDSDPEETKPRSAGTLSPPDPAASADSMTRLGRRVSMQLGLRKSGERSRSRDPAKEDKDDASKKATKKKEEEAAYLRRIMADTGASKSPIELLKTGLGANGSTNGDSITSAAASWLRLGPVTGPSLLHCMRQFTAVESLEGDNMVGCSRCWKLANPGYMSKRRRRDSDSSSSSSEGSSDEEEPAPTRKKESANVLQPSNALVTPDTPDSVSINTKTSETSHADSSYRGPPIPSISTTSPAEAKPILLNGKSGKSSPHTVTASNANSSVYLTPASSRHGSIRRTSSSTTGGDAADDSASTTSVSDVSVPPHSNRQREVQMKVPSLPKSQRVILRRAYKRYLIAVPPPVLVVHLKRFQQVSRTPVNLFASLKKIDDFISFPEYLDLKPFIAPRKEEYGFRPAKIKDNKGAYDEHVMYRLYAVVVHIGNMLGGHYIAYTAVQTPAESPDSENLPKTGPPERKWSFQSDQIVRVASLEEVLAAKAYLCFYERIPEPPPMPQPSSQSPNTQRKK